MVKKTIQFDASVAQLVERSPCKFYPESESAGVRIPPEALSAQEISFLNYEVANAYHVLP